MGERRNPRGLQESAITTTGGRKLIFHVLASLAEFKRDPVRDCQRHGREHFYQKKAMPALKKKEKHSVRTIRMIAPISHDT